MSTAQDIDGALTAAAALLRFSEPCYKSSPWMQNDPEPPDPDGEWGAYCSRVQCNHMIPTRADSKRDSEGVAEGG